MQHLALAVGKAARAVAMHQSLDDRADLVEVAAFQPVHILAVAVVPVRRHVDTQRRNALDDRLDLVRALDGAHADGRGILGRDLERQPGNGHFEDVELRCLTADLFAHDAVDHTGAVHRMHDLISDLKHPMPTSLLTECQCSIRPCSRVKTGKNATKHTREIIPHT